MGAHVGTLPPNVLRQMFAHPLTEKGLAAFLADWAKTGQSILGANPVPPRNSNRSRDLDRPKDKTSAIEPPRAALPARAVAAAEVAAYLRQNPDFLVEHAELLDVLTPPAMRRGEPVIDMQHFMLERQRAEIARLKAQQQSLVATTRANLASQKPRSRRGAGAARGAQLRAAHPDRDHRSRRAARRRRGDDRGRAARRHAPAPRPPRRADSRSRRRRRGAGRRPASRAVRRNRRRSAAVRRRRRAGALGGAAAPGGQRDGADGPACASARAAPASSIPARAPSCSASSPARSASPSRHGSTCRIETPSRRARAGPARPLRRRARSVAGDRAVGELARRRAARLAAYARGLWPRSRELPRFPRRPSRRPA